MSSITSAMNLKCSWQRNNKTGTLTETPSLAFWHSWSVISRTLNLFALSSLPTLTFSPWPIAGFLWSPLHCRMLPLHPGSLCSLFPLLDLSPSSSKIPDFNLRSPNYSPTTLPNPHSVLIYQSRGYSSFLESHGSWCTDTDSTATPTTSLSDSTMHTDNPSESLNSWFLGLLRAKDLILYPISATHSHGHTQTLQLPKPENPSIISFQHLSLQPWPSLLVQSLQYCLHSSTPQGHSTNLFIPLHPPQVHTILLTQFKFYFITILFHTSTSLCLPYFVNLTWQKSNDPPVPRYRLEKNIQLCWLI